MQVERNSFIKKLKEDELKRENILNLQKNLELGIITEESLSNEDKKELEDLYNRQIEDLASKVSKKKSELLNKINIVNEYYKIAIESKIRK